MAKEIVGVIKCPHCCGDATVHRNGKAARLLYYRCGEVYAGASTGCGTVQIYGASGQAWIERELAKNGLKEPKGSEPVADPLPAPVFEPGPIVVLDPVPDPVPVPKPKSVFSSLAEFVGDL